VWRNVEILVRIGKDIEINVALTTCDKLSTIEEMVLAEIPHSETDGYLRSLEV
jgi:hypothetical protein